MMFSHAGMNVLGGCLIVSLPFELQDEVIQQIQEAVLDRVHQDRIRGVVLDVSMVDLMDAHIAASLAGSARMIDVLGARTVVAGIKPVVASALMDLESPPTDLRTAVTVEHALTLLEPFVGAHELAAYSPESCEGGAVGHEESPSADDDSGLSVQASPNLQDALWHD